MSNDKNKDEIGQPPIHDGLATSRSVDWYSPGQSRVVEVNGVRVEIRLVARRGRRARIAIAAPPGTVFLDSTGQNELD